MRPRTALEGGQMFEILKVFSSRQHASAKNPAIVAIEAANQWLSKERPGKILSRFQGVIDGYFVIVIWYEEDSK